MTTAPRQPPGAAGRPADILDRLWRLTRRVLADPNAHQEPVRRPRRPRLPGPPGDIHTARIATDTWPGTAFGPSSSRGSAAATASADAGAGAGGADAGGEGRAAASPGRGADHQPGGAENQDVAGGGSDSSG